MKRLIATCAIVAVAILSMVVLLNDEAVVATDPNYTFTYDDYTLIQGTVESFEGNSNNYLKVNYELKEGEAKIGEYSIVYTKDGDKLSVQLYQEKEVITGNSTYHFVDVVGSTTVFIVPPKVVADGKDYLLAFLVGGDSYKIPGVEKLIISTVDTTALSIVGLNVHNVFKNANDLRTLIIDSKLNLGATNNFINQCQNLSELYIKELGTCEGNILWNMFNSAKMHEVNISFKATNETAFKKINASTNIPIINVTLLPGSVKANVLVFTNVSTVSVFADDWDNTKTLSDLANDVSDTTPELKFYGSISVVSSNSRIAEGEYTTVTVSADKLNGVKSLCVTLNYDSAVFNLKSPPVISDSLKDVIEISGSGEKGEYTVAFNSAQDITGDLLSFQLEVKVKANLGSYTVICEVKTNGSSDGNSSNTFGHIYRAESVITVGALIGDLNSDGKVDENDALYLLLHTFDATGYPIPEGQSVDYNKDNRVDSDDAIYLKNHLGNLEESLSSGGA